MFPIGSQIPFWYLEKVGVELHDKGDWMEAVTATGEVWQSVPNSSNFRRVK